MHLNASLPPSFSTIAAMSSSELKKSGLCNLLEDKDIKARIENVFKTSGLVQFFEKSKDRLIKIVSLGADTSPELVVIEEYAKKYDFRYQYFALDNSEQAFIHVYRQRKNPNASYHLVDSSDIACIQNEIPALRESVDVVLVLQPDLEDEPYPFWKMFLDVIPQIGNDQSMIVASFLQHSEVVRFDEYTKAQSISDLYSSIICRQTVLTEKYIFASNHQWCATLRLKPDSRRYALQANDALTQLFRRIVAAPQHGFYTLAALDDLQEEHITKEVKKAADLSKRLKESTRISRMNYTPPFQLFALGKLL